MEQDVVKLKRLLLAAVVVFVAGCAAENDRPVEVTGQIEAVSVALGSRIGGRVCEVLVEEGDAVVAGDVLVRLEAMELEAAVAAAAAQLAQAEALLAKLEAGARVEDIRQAEAAATVAEERLRLAEKGSRSQEVAAAEAASGAARAQRDEARAVFARIKRLYEGNAASQQRFDEVKHALEAAEEQYRGARERQDMVVEGARSEEIAMARADFDRAAAFLDELRNGARSEDVAAARAARDAAQANLDRARVALAEMTIVAPRAGIVESMDVHPGDLVSPGAVVRLVDPEDLELVLYVGAGMLGHVRVGEQVSLTTDAHGDRRFEGTIARVASKGEFTPRNLQTKEERVQQVFAVKLKLDSAGGLLRAGMAATGHFDLNAGMSQ